MELYTAKQVADKLSWKPRKVVDSVERGIIVPRHKEDTGPGYKRYFQREDIIKLKLFEELKRLGYFRSSIDKVFELVEGNAEAHEAIYGELEKGEVVFLGMVQTPDKVRHITVVHAGEKDNIVLKTPARSVISHFLVNITALRKEIGI